MAFLCPARIRKIRKKRGRKDPPPPLPGRITGSASIDTLVRVGLEKEEYMQHGAERQQMVLLHDFVPCVEDELAVSRGDTVTILYQENDWVYVIAADGSEGFIPFVYCVPMGRNIDDLHASKRRLHPALNNSINENSGAACRPADSECGTDATSSRYSTLDKTETSTSDRNSALSTKRYGQKSEDKSTVKMLNVGLRSTPPGSSSVETYEDPEVTATTPLIRTHGCTKDGYLNTDHKYENVHTQKAGDVINNVATIEVVDVRTFHKEDAGKYIVLFSYRAKEEGDIDVDRGDFVTVLNQDDPDWFWVSKGNQCEGFVPSNFLCPATGATNSGKLEQQTTTSTGSSAASISSQPAFADLPDRKNTAELVVLYDYVAQAPDDVSVTRGEWVYADMTDQPEEGWLWVYAAATNRFGYLPKEFAKPPSIIRNTTTRRSNVQMTPIRSRGRSALLKRTVSLSENHNATNPFDPYLSP